MCIRLMLLFILNTRLSPLTVKGLTPASHPRVRPFQFTNDQRHGRGAMKFASRDGRVTEGQWENDVLVANAA